MIDHTLLTTDTKTHSSVLVKTCAVLFEYLENDPELSVLLLKYDFVNDTYKEINDICERVAMQNNLKAKFSAFKDSLTADEKKYLDNWLK